MTVASDGRDLPTDRRFRPQLCCCLELDGPSRYRPQVPGLLGFYRLPEANGPPRGVPKSIGTGFA